MARKAALLLVAVVAIGGCSAQAISTAVPAGGRTQAPGTQAQTSHAPTPVVTAAPTGPTTYKIGDTITVSQDGSDWATISITDAKVVASYKGTGAYAYTDKPQTAGDVFVQAKVTYTALTNGVDYNPFDWQVFCAGVAVQNYTIVLSGPKPELSSGTLPNGRSASGYVVYEVPAKGEVRMSYGGNTFSNSGPVFEVIIRAS
jgi:hypothetical protein